MAPNLHLHGLFSLCWTGPTGNGRRSCKVCFVVLMSKIRHPRTDDPTTTCLFRSYQYPDLPAFTSIRKCPHDTAQILTARQFQFQPDAKMLVRFPKRWRLTEANLGKTWEIGGGHADNCAICTWHTNYNSFPDCLFMPSWCMLTLRAHTES